jgi:hypothetical protein
MRKFLLILIALCLPLPCFADDVYVGGYEQAVNEVMDIIGAGQPATSVTNTARVYYNVTSDTVKLSVNNGPFYDLTTASDLTSYVPYTGATKDVDLGDYDIAAEKGTFGDTDASGTVVDLIYGNTIDLSASDGTVAVNGTFQGGYNGYDGGLAVFSEQGTTDYLTTIIPHATHTQSVFYWLPAAAGTAGQVLEIKGATGDQVELEWDDDSGGTSGSYVPYTGATQAVDLGSNNIALQSATVSTSITLGSSEYQTQLRPNPAVSATVLYSLPPTAGSAGQVLEISGVTGDTVTLEWDNDNSAAGGSGSVTTVEEGDVAVGDADIVTLDFDGDMFEVSETPNTEINIALAPAASFSTVNTGQGANELYDMDQNVLTTSAVTFGSLDTGYGANELYDMNQNVLTTSDVVFGNIEATQATFSTVSASTVYVSDMASGSVVFATAFGKLEDDSPDFWYGNDYLYAPYFSGDGSGLTNIGADAATALTFSAKAGEALKKGQAVYIADATSALPSVQLADNTKLTSARVVGLAASDAALNAAVKIRRAGTLTVVDTRPTNLDVNPNAETWTVGQLLFATVNGGLTSTRPTSGRSVKAAYTLKGSDQTDTLLAYPFENPVWITCATNENVTLRLGDTAGTNKVSIRNYIDNERAYINSLGAASFTTVTATTFTGDLTGTAVTATTSLTAQTVVNNDFGDVEVSAGAWNVDNDSHAHTSSTISGLDISADTNLSAGDFITLTDDDLDVDTAAVSNGDTTHVPTADGVYDFCETTQAYLQSADLVGANEAYGVGWDNDTGLPEKDDIYDANFARILYPATFTTVSMETVFLPAFAAGATPSVVGQTKIDTTADQFQYYSEATLCVVSPICEKCMIIASPSTSDINVPFFMPYKAIEITGVRGIVEQGTSATFTISDGTNAMEAIAATTSGTNDDSTLTNNTFSANERMEVDVNALSGTPNYLTICVRYKPMPL